MSNSDGFSARAQASARADVLPGVTSFPWTGGFMQARQSWVLDALRRTQDFLIANSELLATVNESSARQILDEIVEQLATHAVSQNGSARGGIGETARQRSVCADLRFSHM